MSHKNIIEISTSPKKYLPCKYFINWGIALVQGKDLEKFQRVIVDQDICIECGACVAACPFQAWEMDENNKARLIWDKCEDDFSCIIVCPVSCIWKSSEAPAEAKVKKGWLRFSRELNDEEKAIFVELNKKHGMADKEK